MGKLVARRCAWCEKEFSARQADVNRGWAKYCSKACKAKHQESRTGQYATLLRNGGAVHGEKSKLTEWERQERDYLIGMEGIEDGSWDGHKDV